MAAKWIKWIQIQMAAEFEIPAVVNKNKLLKVNSRQ